MHAISPQVGQGDKSSWDDYELKNFAVGGKASTMAGCSQEGARPRDWDSRDASICKESPHLYHSDV